GIRDDLVTGVQTCALPIFNHELEIRVVHELPEGREVVERPELRETGNLVLPHQGPREFLVRFEVRCFSRRTNRRDRRGLEGIGEDRKSTRLNSSHQIISYA